MDCNLNSCSGIIWTGGVGHVCVWLFDGLCQHCFQKMTLTYVLHLNSNRLLLTANKIHDVGEELITCCYLIKSHMFMQHNLSSIVIGTPRFCYICTHFISQIISQNLKQSLKQTITSSPNIHFYHNSPLTISSVFL